MKKDKLVLVIIILLLVSSFILITIGESYSFFTYSKGGQTKNKLIVGRHDATGLAAAILDDNDLITDTPNLNTASTTCTTTSSSNGTSTSCTEDDPGLYKSTNTNNSKATYYFRGNVTNNYVSFAGFTWRIVRINEDGTVRIVLQDGINSNASYKFNTASNNKLYMYYSNSNAKNELEKWYTANIGNNYNYYSRVAIGDYFCEQAKVANILSNATNSGTDMTVYSSYTPNFKCDDDTNGYGIVNSSIGLLTYDDVVHAGGYRGIANSNYYLYNNTVFWTMSPCGISSSNAIIWYVLKGGYPSDGIAYANGNLRPVINLKADVDVIGSGLESDMYIVQ